MAVSKCGTCSSTRFELVSHAPSKSTVQFSFVQCSSCGAVAGVSDFFPVGTQAAKILDDLKNLRSEIIVHLQRIEQKLATIK